jgi:cell division protein FtsL
MTSQAVPYAARRARERAESAGHPGSPRIIPLLFFTALVVAIFFSMIYLRIALDRSAFELDAVNDQITLERSRTLDLRLELAQLQDPHRIATQAAQIGLVYPDDQITLIVTGERASVGVLPMDSSDDALGSPAP